MKFYLIAAAILLFGFTVWVTWRNFANNKVVEIFATSLVLGLGVTLLSITFILKPKKTEARFLSAVTVLRDSHSENIQDLAFYDHIKKKSDRPLMPYSDNYLRVKQFYYQKHPEAFEGELDYKLYEGILIYSIISDLFWSFSKTWTADIEYIKGPTNPSIRINSDTKRKSKVVSWDSFSEKISYPIFRETSPGGYSFPIIEQLHVPEGTKINVKEEGFGYIVAMENNKMCMSIKVEWLGTSSSAGEIGRLLNVSRDDMDKFTTYTYRISFLSEIKKWSSGHKDAELYRKWFNSINMILEQNYSYEKYIKEAKEWYLLYSNR